MRNVPSIFLCTRGFWSAFKFTFPALDRLIFQLTRFFCSPESTPKASGCTGVITKKSRSVNVQQLIDSYTSSADRSQVDGIYVIDLDEFLELGALHRLI